MCVKQVGSYVCNYIRSTAYLSSYINIRELVVHTYCVRTPYKSRNQTQTKIPMHNQKHMHTTDSEKGENGRQSYHRAKRNQSAGLTSPEICASPLTSFLGGKGDPIAF